MWIQVHVISRSPQVNEYSLALYMYTLQANVEAVEL